MQSHDSKRKLTLSLNEDVINRAKIARINISDITEQVLKAMTYEPVGNTRMDLVVAYQAFVDATRDLLKKYNASVIIGEFTKDIRVKTEQGQFIEKNRFDIILSGLELYEFPEYGDSEEDSYPTTIAECVQHLYQPVTLLERLITALVNAAEHNHDIIRKLNFAIKFIKILSEEIEGNNDD